MLPYKHLAEVSFLGVEEIYEFLVSLNKQTNLFTQLEISNDKSQILIYNCKANLRTHVPMYVDSSTKAIMLAQSIFGIHWTVALPDYMKYVQQLWKIHKKNK